MNARGSFVNDPYESLINQGLLACLFDQSGNSNSYTEYALQRLLFYAFRLWKGRLVIENDLHDLIKTLPFYTVGKILFNA